MKEYVVVKGEEISVEESGAIMNLKERIIPTLVNTQLNQKQLKQVPHKDILDLSIVYRFVTEDEDGFSAAIVTTVALEQMGISLEELDAIAKENFKLHFPVGDVALLDNLRILTNKHRIFGASGILDKDILRNMSSEMKGDYYLLPVSMHEIMIVPVIEPGIDSLKKIVAQGNSQFISSEEFLSNSIYRYDSENEKLKIEAFQENKETEK